MLSPGLHACVIDLKEALACVIPLQVEAIQSVCPEVTNAEAVKALELCGDRCAAEPHSVLSMP